MVTTARSVAVFLAGIAAVLLTLAAVQAYAQEGEGELRVTSQSIEDGAVLAEVPYVIQLCFSEPVDDGFHFELTTPEGRGVGKRVSFQRDRIGVEVFPGGIPGLPGVLTPAADRIWTFAWRVTAQDDEAATEGALTFTLDDDGDVIPEETLPDCRVGSFFTPDPAATGSETTDDGDSTDILYIVLLVAAAVGALGVVSLVGYVIRKRGEGGRGGTASGGTPAG